MKRTNNKFRNNNYNNQIYSLNYKFDSNSIAGKVSGTALDLIKRYNELAKEAHTNNDYVSAEVFRQYAEHYRKIVTEINEKKTRIRMPAITTASSRPPMLPKRRLKMRFVRQRRLLRLRLRKRPPVWHP